MEMEAVTALLKNRLIVLESIDNGGKDGTAVEVQAYLVNRGWEVEIHNEPTDVGVGVELRDILQKKIPMPEPMKLQQLFDEDRQAHVQQMAEWLEVKSNRIIICVRYFYSTLAYGLAMEVNSVDLWKLVRWTPHPACAIYLDIEPKLADERRELGGKKKEALEGMTLQQKVRREYLALPPECLPGWHTIRDISPDEKPFDICRGRVLPVVMNTMKVLNNRAVAWRA